MKSSQIIEFSNAFTLTDKDIIELFDQEHGWQNKYRRIMLIGKSLPEFNTTWQQDDARVQGCESDVWLYTLVDENNNVKLAASSNAKIIRGLVAIVLAAFNAKSRQQIQNFDIDAYFNQLGILTHLSPSRGNGIKAIINAIQAQSQTQ